MQNNILKDTEVQKIYLIYKDNGSTKKELVRIQFMDTKKCYLQGRIPEFFKKPKKRTNAELRIYTPDGIYKTGIKIYDATMSLSKVLYEVDAPKKYELIQLRTSTRKAIHLPITIRFIDGMEIETETYDFALGGLSFYSDACITLVQQKFNCIVNIDFTNTEHINFPDNKLITEAKFLRQSAKDSGKTFYAFRFTQLSKEQQILLKKFLVACD